MLTILPKAQLVCVANYSYSFVECEGILKVQYQTVSITVCRYGRVSVNEGIRFAEITEIIKMV